MAPTAETDPFPEVREHSRMTDDPVIVDMAESPRRPEGKAAARWAALGVASLAAAAFWVRWHFLTSSSTMPLGIDGFYYAVQLRSLLQGQGLYYPAAPMAFWLMLPGAWALGPVAGMKFGAALGTALAALPVYAIVRRATGRRGPGLLGVALVVTSAGSFHLAAEFVKQGIGLTIALTFVATLASALDAPSGWRRRILLGSATLLFTATLLTHLTSTGVAFLFALPLVAGELLRGRPRLSARAALSVIVGLAALVTLVALVMAPAGRGLGLGHLVGPVSFGFLREATFHFEVAAGGLAALVLIALMAMGRIPDRARLLLVGPAVFALLLAVPWLSEGDPQGLVFRIRIMAFVPLAICAPALLAHFTTRVAGILPHLLPFVAAVALLLLVPFREPPSPVYANRMFLPGAAAIADRTPTDAVIVVDSRQMAFMVKWAADREARTAAPSGSDPRPLFHLAIGNDLPPRVREGLESFEAGLPANIPRPVHLLPDRPMAMVLFAAPTWQSLMQRADAADRASLEAWRPVN